MQLAKTALFAATLLAVAASGLPRDAFLQVDDTPLQKVPVVGDQFKVNPVSTSMKCVISLTIQYMIVFTILAICRTAADSWGMDYGSFRILEILNQATYTVAFAPMLAVLFLGCRMRVTWLTQGQGNPPEYVQVAMYCCTYSVLVMTIVVCVIPIFTGHYIKGVDPKTGNLPDDNPFTNWVVAGCFTALKYLIMLGLYVGSIVVVYGIITFVPPKGIWPGEKIPPVSPAVQCTMILTCQFFIVYGFIQFSKTFSQFSERAEPSTFEKAMVTATNSMNFAPMLAVMFIGARMRALQMDPVHGHPQRWAQNCFFACTYALLVQTCLCIAVPVVLGGTTRTPEGEGAIEGDMHHDVPGNDMIGYVLTVAKYCILIGLYVGVACVMYSVFTIEHPRGAQYTPPISVTMQCVINLATQYFVVYLGIWICVTVKELTKQNWKLLTNTMESCKGTISFCPMLAILFVGTRMRALLITNNRGAPQGWAQDGMYMATWAVLIQFLTCLIVPFATGTVNKCDKDGTPEWKPDHPILNAIAQVLKWITFIFLYGGTIAVIVAVYTMTPETANGRGAVPLVGDGKVPGVDAKVPLYDGVKEPYGANDIPGTPMDEHSGPKADVTSPGF